jgi:uncharacterized lipoprotein NlpE involved in copper resistance
MKKIIIFLIVLIGLMLVGCAPSREEVPAINRGQLAGKGEVVGVLPDGREVKRWSVLSASGNYWHAIYIVVGLSVCQLVTL